MSKTLYGINYIVDDSESEGTSRPIWYIIRCDRQRLVNKKELQYEIMNRIIGPFGSRRTAEHHRQSRIYDYGEDSVVFCHSAYYSDLAENRDCDFGNCPDCSGIIYTNLE